MNKKILTFDDLCHFFVEMNRDFIFSSRESGYDLRVQIPARFEEDSADDSLMFCKIKLMHTGENRNHSSVTEGAAKKAMKNLAYKPVLANFCEINGVKDFTSHDMEFNKDGTVTYIEHQIGCFTVKEPYMEADEETGRKYIYAFCAIPREYTDACEIIERKGGTKVSVELAVKEMNYSVKNKVLELTDIEVMGATCLGTDPDTGNEVTEGMVGARLDIIDFDAQHNSIVSSYDEKLDSLREKLDILLSRFDINENTEKGGKQTLKFDELLKKYNVTIDDITFEYEGMSDDELEAIFKATFEGETGTDNETPTEGAGDNPTNVDPENPGDNPTNVDPENPGGGEEGGEEDEPTDEKHSNDDDDEENPKKKINQSLIRSFEVSHEDIRYALYSLLSAVEEDENDVCFITSVYDDYFIYESYVNGKFYGQKYSVAEDGNVKFVDDRYTLYVEYLTEAEHEELKTMRAGYPGLVEFKASVEAAEAHQARLNVLEDKKYAMISGKDSDGDFTNEAYANLYAKMDEYSVDELEKEAKIILAEYALNGGKFSATDETTETHSVKFFANPAKKTKKKNSRYGSLKF